MSTPRLVSYTHPPTFRWVFVVYNTGMPRFVEIPEIILQRIYSMYEQGYSYKRISIETGYGDNIIRARLAKSNNKLVTAPKVTCRGMNIPRKVPKVSKYAHLFEEKICQGKMYAEYLKK